MGKKILIIKLAAMGDVLRTTSILTGLGRKYPNPHISWLVNAEASAVLENNPEIERIFIYNLDSVLRLQVEKFDLLLSLDKAISALSLARLIHAEEKKGFGLHDDGYLYPLNKESEYAFRLGIDDELKFRQNKRTYQELIYEMAGLEYKNDEYILHLSDNSLAFGKCFRERIKAKKGDLIIGLNTGSGDVFATKKWTAEGFAKLARMLKNKLSAKVILLGGPNEIECNRQIKSRLKEIVIDSGCRNSLKEFAGIIDCCDIVVSADTLAMQLAIALKKKVVAIFGSTCHQEVDLFGRGKKIVSSASCAPCYRRNCDDMKCMRSISADDVFTAVRRLARK